MLRFVHTADWHLGHSLHDLPRDREHAAFLDWLLGQLEEHAVDALLVAGDVFDTANPPARAMRRWFGFLADARRRLPALDIVVIGGNHDSAARLEAAHPLLEAFGVHVLGRLPRTPDGDLDLDRVVVPLHDADGLVAAWCTALPFLRPADLPAGAQPGIADGGDGLIAGVRKLYDDAMDRARARCSDDVALVAMGHLYMVGGALSELSERKVLGGNQHALPADIFPADAAYVALGHLHRAQQVGARDTVRYAGSPIPLAMDEAPYPHQVRLVQLEGKHVASQRSLRVPRAVDILRLPEGGPAPWEELAPMLAALPPAASGPRDAWPYLEVRVRLDEPRPTLRRDVDAAVADKAVRLVRIAVQRTGDGRSLGDARDGRDLSELGHEEVFRRKWRRDHDGDPGDDVLACFHQLVDQLGQGGAA